MVPSEARLDKVHLKEHERARNQEKRELPALVAQRVAALVAHDGVHHGEACAKAAHELFDEHETCDYKGDGGRLDVDRQGSLVADSRLVLLRLEQEYSCGKVKNADGDKERLSLGDSRHEEHACDHKKDEPQDDGGDDGDFGFVMQNSHDVRVEHAHEPRNGICRPDGEAHRNVGEAEGDGNGCRDRLELRVLEVGTHGTERRDHKD